MKTLNSQQNHFERYFLNKNEDSLKAYEEAINQTKETILEEFSHSESPYSGKGLSQLYEKIHKMKLFSEEGEELPEILDNIRTHLLQHSIKVSHPLSIAHLHCPPLNAALAAEMIISAFNQSMDSWDQSPSATYLENELINWLCNKFGYLHNADGVFTSGGTQSNYMGLMLARDSYSKKQLNWDVQKYGLPAEANRFRVLCSKEAHFTVKQSVAQLGLGEQAVVLVDTDENHRICLDDFKYKLNKLKMNNLIPFAVVATCGTTDFGSIDPLPSLAEIATNHNMWLHVDAAYGGALILSSKHREKLAGIDRADSLTIDFHKLFYQPISCGAFLLKDRNHFNLMTLHADYLNSKEDEQEGIINLVGKSIQTTRRFDALKLLISLRVVGIETFKRMIEYTIDLAGDVARFIEEHSSFELMNKDPEINAIVFRYLPDDDYIQGTNLVNQINRQIQQYLLSEGFAVIAKTTVDGKTCLKFTLLNPTTKIEDVKEILREITRIGNELSKIETEVTV